MMIPINRLFRSARMLVALVLLALVVAACATDGEDNVTYVVVPAGEEVPASDGGAVSDNVTPLPTAEPSPVPPTPTPTPDTPPEIALQIGDRYLLDGYFENAVYTYQSVVDNSAAPQDVRAAAALGMGQAALREGLFDYAVQALTALITQFPADFRATQGYFLRGDAYLGLNRWQEAIDDFQQYLTLRPGLIDSYVHERIGDAQLALERYEDAFNSYTRAADATRSLVPQLALREKLAQLHTLSGQVEEAVAQYDAILAVARNEPYRATIEFRAAEALLDAGDRNNGLQRMERIFNEYVDQPQAFQAMDILLENGRELDQYAIGRVSYFSQEYGRAIEAFNAYTSQMQLAAIPPELHLLLGRSYRAMGNPAAAQVAFQTLIDQHPTDPLFGDALLETGRTYFLNDEIDQAITRYLEIAENYDYLPETAAEALWRAAYLHGTNDNLSESRGLFMRLADAYPESSQASSGLFIAASAALNAGDAANAETLYGRLAVTTTGEQQAEAYLQVGRLALERGDERQAESAFSSAAAAAPDSYFSARAQDIRDGRAPFTPPDEYVFEFDDLAEVTAAENWLRETFGAGRELPEGPLWPLSAELEAEPRVVRGREL
ncbi:MAG: tetratricopeptide repeat protein, partial [Phototrophicaceae bacterium]